ncbi:MAG TPA: L-serine ammonia-lyase, iron-sulfur-dependent, subunit alpha [Candidatus Acidoferrum sp.]|nr:L-serine ammonia-lyase, iron-sulfur-dependent, subunit alpha [Candidatus Acidoferrum sp.]
MAHYTLSALLSAAGEGKISAAAIAAEVADTERTEEAVRADMARALSVMREAAEAGLRNAERSPSGLSGGDSVRMQQAIQNGLLTGCPLIADMMAIALAVAEQNAKMGRIVACPTAGSCGIVPAVLFALQKANGYTDEALVDALFTAGAVGVVIAKNASIAGASGGCQAECGSAAAMAAAAAVELAGGRPLQAGHAVAFSLKSLMGLVCDPVGGLVEVPCIKRNAFCAVSAYVSASMALAGIESLIPADEVIRAMDEVGKLMPSALKETAKGGIAATPTAHMLAKAIMK